MAGRDKHEDGTPGQYLVAIIWVPICLALLTLSGFAIMYWQITVIVLASGLSVWLGWKWGTRPEPEGDA